ncbi:MAG: ribbon-helix-helix protein, CopG family [Cyanophyceae cyanobacterium]
MTKIPIACRVDEAVAHEVDELAQSRGQDRAGFLRAAIARELGDTETGESVPAKVARLESRVSQLERVLMLMTTALAQL